MTDLSEKDFERIEDFLLGRMSESEKINFEKSIQEDSALAQAVKEQKNLITAIESEGMRADLESIHDELYGSNSQKRRPYLLFSAAASLAVLIGFGFWFFFLNESDADLIAEYAYIDPGLPVPMSATDSYDFYDAMVDYKTEDYNIAIEKWTPLLSDDPGNDTLNYYIGAAFFNLSEYDKANPYLKKVALSENSTFSHKANYMLFLSDWRSGDEAAVRNFTPSENSPFLPEIRAIQESVKK
jgi:tetratricopeptide (TPR) repeat protein